MSPRLQVAPRNAVRNGYAARQSRCSMRGCMDPQLSHQNGVSFSSSNRRAAVSGSPVVRTPGRVQYRLATPPVHLPLTGRPRGGRLRVARRARRPAHTVPPSQDAAPHTTVAAAAGAAGSPRQRSFLVALFAGDVLEVADVVAGLKVGDRAGHVLDREGRQVLLAGEQPQVGVALLGVVDAIEAEAAKLRAYNLLEILRVRLRRFGRGLPALPPRRGRFDLLGGEMRRPAGRGIGFVGGEEAFEV